MPARADDIEVVAYDAAWPVRFRAIAAQLRRELGSVALRIDHIGSTAVPGLAAKPVIDAQVSVAALDPVEPFRLPLERAGYVWRSENPDRTKRYFRERPARPRTHIHVRRAGSFSEQLALLFRDYTRVHPGAADRYAALKRRLAEEHREDRAGYTDAKGPFVWATLADASEWSQRVGWAPGPSDA